jgi:type VI secretion system protein ImpH
MASADGRTGAGLIRELFEAPYRFDFFQAVRLLEHHRREQARSRGPVPDGAPPEGTGVGRDLDPSAEAVRFRSLASLSFPAAEISDLREGTAGPHDPGGPHPFEMIVTFLGLTGPNGVLPRHYTELLIQRIREKDESLRDFLDLFNHRLISLFYRSWEKGHWPFAYERARLDDPGGDPDLVTRGVYGLVGLGTAGLRGRLEVDDEVFLYYSGHFAHHPRSAIGLECVLADYFEMPVAVLQCQGQWLTLEPEDHALMPSPARPEGQNNQLGVSLVVGERIWDLQSKFRLRVGPLTWRQFRSLMPNGSALRPLCQLTRFYAGPTLDFDVQPVLRPEEIPPCRLSPDPDAGPYLGWNAWMPRPITASSGLVDDAVFQIPDL